MSAKRRLLLITLAATLSMAVHSCYNPSIQHEGFLCDRNGKCPREFDCVDEGGKKVCRKKGGQPPDLGVKPDIKTGPCKEEVVETGVKTSLSGFDLALTAGGVPHLFYLRQAGEVYQRVLTGTVWSATAVGVQAEQLAAILDSQGTIHMLLDDQGYALYTARKDNRLWQTPRYFKVKKAAGQNLTDLDPNGIHLSGRGPLFGVVDGVDGFDSKVSPFNIVTASPGPGVDFTFPCLIEQPKITYGHCQTAAGSSKQYLTCSTTHLNSSKSWWIAVFGNPPSCTPKTTAINTTATLTGMVISQDSGGTLHMAYLDQVAASGGGGYLYYATWAGAGAATTSTTSIYQSERLRDGSLDIATNSKGDKAYITAQTLNSPKLLLFSGPQSWATITVSTNGGAESRLAVGPKNLHFAHVDSQGNLRYSCLLP